MSATVQATNWPALTSAQAELVTVSSGTLSYWCGSPLHAIIDLYRNNVMAFAAEHPELKTWRAAVVAYNLQLEPAKENDMKQIPHPVRKFEIKVESHYIDDADQAYYDVEVFLNGDLFYSRESFGWEDLGTFLKVRVSEIAKEIEEYHDEQSDRLRDEEFASEPYDDLDDPALSDPVLDEYDR